MLALHGLQCITHIIELIRLHKFCTRARISICHCNIVCMPEGMCAESMCASNYFVAHDVQTSSEIIIFIIACDKHNPCILYYMLNERQSNIFCVSALLGSWNM